VGPAKGSFGPAPKECNTNEIPPLVLIRTSLAAYTRSFDFTRMLKIKTVKAPAHTA